MKAIDDNTDLSHQLTGRGKDFDDLASGGEFDFQDSDLGEDQNYSGNYDGDNSFTGLGGEDYYDLEED